MPATATKTVSATRARKTKKSDQPTLIKPEESIVIQSSTLKPIIQHSLKAIPGKPAMPILACFRLTFASDRLSVFAFDGDTMISNTTTDLSNPVGSLDFCVNAKDFAAIVNLLNGEIWITPVRNELGDLSLKIECGSMSYSIQTQIADCYPEFPEFQGETDFKISSDAVRSIVALTSVPNPDAAQTLRGIELRKRPDSTQIQVGVTDSICLAIVDIEAEIDPSIEFSAILTTQSASLLAARCEECQVRLQIGQWIQFEFDGLTIQSRLIEGSYPDLSRFKTIDAVTTIELPIDTLKQNMTAALITSDRENLIVKFTTSASLLIENRRIGEMIGYRNLVEVDSIESNLEEHIFALKAGLVLKCLAVLSAFGGKVKIEVNEASLAARLSVPDVKHVTVFLVAVQLVE